MNLSFCDLLVLILSCSKRTRDREFPSKQIRLLQIQISIEAVIFGMYKSNKQSDNRVLKLSKYIEQHVKNCLFLECGITMNPIRF